MAKTKVTAKFGVSDVIEHYGKCLELVTMDPSFHDVTVGLYEKNDTCTVWSFSRKPGIEDRIREIRDRLVEMGGLSPVKGTHNQVVFPCGYLHNRPIKFLLAQAVGKAREYAQPSGNMSIKDTKTELILRLTVGHANGKCMYQVSSEGEAPNIPMRLKMVVAGFVRYGEMEKVSDDMVTFPCGQRHDELIKVLLPYSRNISAVENMLDAESLRGQLTTGTLGFSPM